MPQLLFSRRGRTGPFLGGAAAAVVAAFGAAFPAVEAQAAIVYSGLVNVNAPTTLAGVYLNVVTGVASATPGGSPGWDINVWGTSTVFFYANNSASPNDGVVTSLGSSSGLVDNLALGTLINGSLGYGRVNSSETTGPTAFLLNSSSNYIGFRFLNEGTGALNFGWLQFQTAGTLNGQPRAVLSWAYENTGAGIAVGDTGAAVNGVSEPASLALVGAALAAGLTAARRRRTA
jgi:hypothetical protein